jgi:hypothetical protein
MRKLLSLDHSLEALSAVLAVVGHRFAHVLVAGDRPDSSARAIISHMTCLASSRNDTSSPRGTSEMRNSSSSKAAQPSCMPAKRTRNARSSVSGWSSRSFCSAWRVADRNFKVRFQHRR